MTIRAFLCVCLLSVNASAVTYYIDYANGLDANNGTSKATPWQRHPWMRGYSGSYRHAAGDQFIFKGGVTWPAQQCLTMSIQGSGTPSTPDYYGVDKTWYDGSSWTKPKFDAQGAEFNNGWVVMIQIPAVAPQHDIIIDNIDFTGIYWSSTIRALGGVAYITIGASTNISIQNCNFRNWSHASYSGQSYEDQLNCIIGYNQPPYTAGCVISNCLFDGETVANKGIDTSSCQASVFGWGGKILNCTVRNSAGGLFPSGAPAGQLAEISGCTIGPLYRSYDPTMHHDGIQDNGGKGLLVHDNYIFDVYSVPIFLGAGWGGGTYYVYNNVMDLRVQTMQTPITFDAQSGGNTFYIYNNTIIAAPGLAFMRANYRPTGGNNIANIDVRNNHCIGEGSLLKVDTGVTISSFTDQNNAKQTFTDATALGYNRANWYKPVSGSVVTVNSGQDLSSFLSGVLLKDLIGSLRPQGGRWDIGAFEWADGGVVITPTQAPSAPRNLRVVSTAP